MKVQITKKAKGELYIRSIGKSMKVGAMVLLSEDQYHDSETQAAIQAGFLDIVEGSTDVLTKGEEYINVYKNSLSFKCLRRSIQPGATFFVREELVDEPEIVSAFNAGYIQLAEPVDADDKAEETGKTASESKAKTPKKKTAKKASKKAVKKTAKKDKKIKRIDSEAESEDVETYSLPEKEQAEVPVGMYAHDPTGEGMTVRKAKGRPKKASKSNDLEFVESTRQAEEIGFVDQEQTKERAKKNGITEDVFIDNVEVE